MATPPIRSQVEIEAIINRGEHAIADIGLEIMTDANLGIEATDVTFRDKVYRLILLQAYLQNLLDENTGELKLYWTATANEKALNVLLDAIVSLAGIFNGPAIPLITGRRGALLFFPSTSGPSSGGQSNSGGPSSPGGVTFQNTSIDAPGDIIDTIDATANQYAFYIIFVRGSGGGEGARLDMVSVNWVNASQPVVTNTRGDDSGGTTAGVTYSASIVAGIMELRCNVPTDGWSVRGTRISFQNISFENAQGPLPTGGTAGQYLRKTTSVDYEAAFATIQMSEIAGLSALLAALIPTAWTTITLDAGNGYISGARTPQYRVTGFGVVELRGIISNSGSPPVGDHQVATLPVGVQQNQLLGVNAAANAIATCYVTAAGALRAITGGAWTGTIILDGTSYHYQ